MARWYPLALTVVLAVSAGEPAMAIAAAPSQTAGNGFPVPALLGGMVLAFAVGLTAAQVRRRRRPEPPPAKPVGTAEPAPPEPATPPPEPAAPPRPAPPPREPAATPVSPRSEPAATPEARPEPAAPRRRAPPPPQPVAPPQPRVVRLEPPRATPPPPPPPAPAKPEPEPEPVEADAARWVPPEPVRPAARSSRERAAAPNPSLQAPEAPLPGDAAPPAPEAPLDEAPESLVERPRARARPRPVPRDEPWPEESLSHWTCEIMWKAGYVKSSFRAMAGAPGSGRRRPIGESPPLRWTLMTDPDPPTPEMVAGVRALVDALIADGWERTGSAGPWYAQRFLWRGSGEPGSVVVEPPMDAGEASSA